MIMTCLYSRNHLTRVIRAVNDHGAWWQIMDICKWSWCIRTWSCIVPNYVVFLIIQPTSGSLLETTARPTKCMAPRCPKLWDPWSCCWRRRDERLNGVIFWVFLLDEALVIWTKSQLLFEGTSCLKVYTNQLTIGTKKIILSHRYRLGTYAAYILYIGLDICHHMCTNRDFNRQPFGPPQLWVGSSGSDLLFSSFKVTLMRRDVDNTSTPSNIVTPARFDSWRWSTPVLRLLLARSSLRSQSAECPNSWVDCTTP